MPFQTVQKTIGFVVLVSNACVYNACARTSMPFSNMICHANNVGTGNEGLEMYVSADPPVKLVLLDVTLPDMSGHEVRALHALRMPVAPKCLQCSISPCLLCTACHYSLGLHPIFQHQTTLHTVEDKQQTLPAVCLSSTSAHANNSICSVCLRLCVQVCTKMRSLTPGVPPPIIMISGRASTKDVVKGLQVSPHLQS